MSASRKPENPSDTNDHIRQLASPGHESPRRSSQEQGPSNRNPGAGAQRVPSSSPDRFDARFPRFQQPALSPVTSPGLQEATKLLSRDSTNQRPSNSPIPGRSRNSAANFPPSSMRHRFGSAYLSPSPDPTRPWRDLNESRRGSVAIAAASGRDSDAISRKFSLGGVAPQETFAPNQNYVDPGYALLNPAYDQPANVRPVWSMAKPLPHVLGPATLPSRAEIRREMQQHRDEDDQFDISEDLETGRIHLTLRPDKIFGELDNIRRSRERRLLESYQQQHDASPALSPFSGTRKGSTTSIEVTGGRHRVEETIIEEDEEQSQHRRKSLRQSELDFPHLSQAIANVNRTKDEEHLDCLYQDAVPLAPYGPEEVEIHNLHNYWSVIRLRFRNFLAELLGITIQYTLGLSVNLTMAVSHGASRNSTDWGWGFATMAAIYVASGTSGAHFNPAITIMLCVWRGFPRGQVPIYIAAHVLGAFIAAMITFSLFRPGLMALSSGAQSDLHVLGEFHTSQMSSSEMPAATHVLRNFITYPRAEWVTFRVAFYTEMLAATILGVVVLALLDDTNTPPGSNMTPFIIALVVTLLGMAFGYNTGLALNPARDFGPRAAMTMLGYKMTPNQSLWEDWYWLKVACAGPICGTLLGGFVYDFMIFTGSESLVNWPTRRYMRASTLWWERLKARITRTAWKMKDAKDDFGSLGATGGR